MRRLYRAVCSWLEASAEQMREPLSDEPDREGDVSSLVDLAHRYTSEPEMHSGHRGTSIDYDDDDGGAYRLPRSRPISLRWSPRA